MRSASPVGSRREPKRDRRIVVAIGALLGVALALVLIVAGATAARRTASSAPACAIVIGVRCFWLVAPHRSTVIAIALPLVHHRRRRALSLLRGAAGVHVQRDPRLLPRQPLRREHRAWHARSCGRASSSLRGSSRPRVRRVAPRRSALLRRASAAAGRAAIRAARRRARGGDRSARCCTSTPARSATRSTARRLPTRSAAPTRPRTSSSHYAQDARDREATSISSPPITSCDTRRSSRSSASRRAGKLTSYYFANREQKARWIGAQRRRDGEAVAA